MLSPVFESFSNTSSNTKIVGRGMIAKGLTNISEKINDVMIFASGVSNSLCIDQKEYDRECELLYKMIVECKKNNQTLVYFSSAGAVYGDFDEVKDEESSLFPKTMYGKYKVFFESVIVNSGINYLILRLPNVVGPKQNKNQLFPTLVLQAINRKANLFKNAGRDLIDIDDVCNILTKLLEKDIKNHIIIVASGHCVSIPDIFDEIQLLSEEKAIINLLNRGDKQAFCTKKLYRLLPEMEKFEPDYYRHLIQKYVPLIMDEMHAKS